MEASSRPVFEYLRLSITDRCNLRCVYCMPPEGVPKVAHAQILRYETILAVVEAAIAEGVHRVRVTGGEPLVRKGVVELVRQLAGFPRIDDLSLTTNGVLLARLAAPLREAGLHRVNVSLDSLRPERFTRITRLGRIEEVLAGIEAAIRCGLAPVKINVVIIPGENDDEIEDFGRFAQERAVDVRFIERMPFQAAAAAPFVPQEAVLDRLSRFLTLAADDTRNGGGPAQVFRIVNGRGRIGFISSRTHPFCQSCNRLRLTATGVLLPCLDSREGFPVENLGQEQLRTLIRDLGARKRATGKPCARFEGARCVSLSDIGG
ncbi:MAG: GTP 3',8-cyclase MoaA [Candidatus Riflebacteria bacterium]|nr:GTP 3',8-cyclase MoaA [Candidatus Riflebacteria bacterium]